MSAETIIMSDEYFVSPPVLPNKYISLAGAAKNKNDAAANYSSSRLGLFNFPETSIQKKSLQDKLDRNVDGLDAPPKQSFKTQNKASQQTTQQTTKECFFF